MKLTPEAIINQSSHPIFPRMTREKILRIMSGKVNVAIMIIIRITSLLRDGSGSPLHMRVCEILVDTAEIRRDL
jgi:hypothetical protein